MTEAMMMPDEGLADRLADVCYSVRSGRVKELADYDAEERGRLQRVAAGELAVSATQALSLRNAWRDTIVSYTAGISDDTLLDDLAAWIERCAKPPFDAAPYAEALTGDIAGVTRSRLGGLSKDEVTATWDYLGSSETTVWSEVPFSKAAYDAAAALRDLG